MSRSILEVLHFNSKDNRPLPRLGKGTRLLLRTYSIFPSRLVRRQISRALGLSGKVDFLPGFTCFAGRVVCKGRASLCDTFFLDYAPVIIEDGVGFGYRNMVITSTHSMENFNDVEARPIHIGANAWITCGVTILGGVSIGANSVIGAGSVVTCDIPPDVFAAGNPCRVIRPRNSWK